ncbi:hypothetical protein BU16DRAFT_17309 [Lophium mytilinum]|uniref:Uncharacterized protein n=1 Tax=Lophium mytilinum TaxID=390894 RepID=A0A6A6RG87_9PEZI|nr:hypothetical protein BU16DRAFT_17309 [Lophium mytilinum]
MCYPEDCGKSASKFGVRIPLRPYQDRNRTELDRIILFAFLFLPRCFQVLFFLIFLLSCFIMTGLFDFFLVHCGSKPH